MLILLFIMMSVSWWYRRLLSSIACFQDLRKIIVSTETVFL